MIASFSFSLWMVRGWSLVVERRFAAAMRVALWAIRLFGCLVIRLFGSDPKSAGYDDSARHPEQKLREYGKYSGRDGAFEDQADIV